MKPGSRVPILLSAFGCPGVGQFFQKRWIAGVVFAAGFLVGFLWVMKLAFHNIIELYSMAFSSDMSSEPDPVPISAFVTPLIIAGICWIVSLFDVFLAQQRMARYANETAFAKNSLADLESSDNGRSSDRVDSHSL